MNELIATIAGPNAEARVRLNRHTVIYMRLANGESGFGTRPAGSHWIKPILPADTSGSSNYFPVQIYALDDRQECLLLRVKDDTQGKFALAWEALRTGAPQEPVSRLKRVFRQGMIDGVVPMLLAEGPLVPDPEYADRIPIAFEYALHIFLGMIEDEK